MFTVFYVKEDAVLGNHDYMDVRPVLSQDAFHSQFRLKLNEYRDNNNYFVHNKISTNDNRLWPYRLPNQFQYLSLDKGPEWTAGKYKIEYKSKEADGTYKN